MVGVVGCCDGFDWWVLLVCDFCSVCWYGVGGCFGIVLVIVLVVEFCVCDWCVVVW